jgi:hypothetical protein
LSRYLLFWKLMVHPRRDFSIILIHQGGASGLTVASHVSDTPFI